MKYALILERDTQCCNTTSTVIASLGYLITPVFSAKKALHAAHMIQFDLIVTHTGACPDDRRSLIGELKRCSPESVILLLTEPEDRCDEGHELAEGSIVIHRPLTVQSLQAAITHGYESDTWQPVRRMHGNDRRKRAVD